MRFPTIALIAKQLRDMSLKFAKETRVILRVAEDGSWSLQAESEQSRIGDTPHHLAACSIPGANGKAKRFPSTELARDLVKDVKDAHTAHSRAEKDAKQVARQAKKHQAERRRRTSQQNTPPFQLGTRVKSGGVRGTVVGHGVVHGQLGPVHVHLIQVDNPQQIAEWNTYVSIIPIADSLVKVDFDAAETGDAVH